VTLQLEASGEGRPVRITAPGRVGRADVAALAIAALDRFFFSLYFFILQLFFLFPFHFF
jgi:hypothetical protein